MRRREKPRRKNNNALAHEAWVRERARGEILARCGGGQLLNGRELSARDELWPWGQAAKGLNKRIFEAVVHEEHVATWERGDVAVGAVLDITIEQDDRPCGDGKIDYASLFGEAMKSLVAGHSVLLLPERILVVFLRRLANA